MAVRRIQNDLRDLAKSKCGISVEALNDNLQKLKGKLSGPPDTPYEGGEFILDINIPPGYPFKPLRARFVTKIWHPNISFKTGDICLDILQSAWTPSMTMRTVLLSIQALLQDPEPCSALNGEAAIQCLSDSKMYNFTARYLAHVYAGAPGSNEDLDDKVKKMKDMGADEETAVTLLAAHSWNLEIAMQFFHRRPVPF